MKVQRPDSETRTVSNLSTSALALQLEEYDMARTSEKQTNRICKEEGCTTIATEGPRCKTCHRAWKSASARKRREQKRKNLLLKNEELKHEGKRVCARCFHVKTLSEFGTTLAHRKGKLNKLCDECLTHIYTRNTRYKMDHSLTHHFWRKKAYAANSVARNRYAKEKAIPIREVSLTDIDHIVKPQQLAKLYQEQKGICKYCKVALTVENISIDHIIPVSRSGSNAPENLQLVCQDCNYLKRMRTHPEFVEFVQTYIKRFAS